MSKLRQQWARTMVPGYPYRMDGWMCVCVQGASSCADCIISSLSLSVYITWLQFHNGGKKGTGPPHTHRKSSRKMRKEILEQEQQGPERMPPKEQAGASLQGCRLEWPQWHWVSVNGNRREALGQILGKGTTKAETSIKKGGEKC